MASTRDQELGLLHIDMEAFTFHTFLPGVHDEHQAIRVERLPQHTSAELTQKRLQCQDEEQWAKDWALMHTPTPNSSLYWPLTYARLQELGVHALVDMHSPFLDPEAPKGPP